MKKIYNIILLLAVAAVSLVSCDDPTYPNQTTDEGTLKISSLGIEVDASESVVVPRSGHDVGGFTVRILDGNTNLLKHSWTYTEMPEVITLPVGEYKLEVYNDEVSEAAFDAPYYMATETFEIKKNAITELGTVTCKLQNVKVSVTYSDELQKLLGEDVKVVVEVAQKNMLEYVVTETRAGYFRYYQDNTTMVASFSGTVDGVFISEDHKIITDVKPGKHYVINFSYKSNPMPGDEAGTVVGTTFSLDASVTIKNENRNINIDDEIIEPFDFLTTSISKISFPSAASSKVVEVKSSSAWTATSSESWCTISDITSAGFTVNVADNTSAQARTANVVVAMGKLTKTIAVTQAEYSDSKPAPSFTSDNIDLENYNDAALFGEGLLAAEVLITAPNGIKSLMVTINSETLTSDILLSVGLDSQFDLATGKSVGGADLTGGLAGLGFPVANGGTINDITYAPVVDQTEVKFDITQFIPLLGVYGPGKHNFELSVTDNAGQVSSAIIKFETK